jgi:hypothetical protein
MTVMIDMKKMTVLFFSTLVVPLFFVACKNQQAAPDIFTVEASSEDAVPSHHILELSFRHNGVYKDNFFDIEINASFTSPSGAVYNIKGFYYRDDVWKIRFRPDEAGVWNYAYSFTGKTGFQREGAGTFHCEPSGEDGRVLQNPANRYRWVFSEKRPYFPVGLQDCISVKDGKLEKLMIDGEMRHENRARRVSADEYFSLYGEAGFNLLRFSQKNCSYVLYDDLDHYRVDAGLVTDKLLSSAYRHGFRIMFGIFGAHGNWMNNDRSIRVFKRTIQNILGTKEEALWRPEDKDTVFKERRFIDYSIARWGVYVDFWELLNERRASDEWLTSTANYIQSTDPYDRPVSTSWDKPDLAAIDINAPHWYESENEFQSDVRVQQMAAEWKKPGKPVIVGEHGNSGMNWDPLSGRRMRIRLWTALFQEISFVFWNTSWAKNGNANKIANIYLGPEERAYVRALQDFSSHLDSDIRITSVAVSPSNGVRAFGLRSDNVSAVYLHHFDNHSSRVDNVMVAIRLPVNSHSKNDLIGEWIDPASGKVLSRFKIYSADQPLKSPSFTVDMALLVRSGSIS